MKAEPADLQSAPFDRSGTSPFKFMSAPKDRRFAKDFNNFEIKKARDHTDCAHSRAFLYFISLIKILFFNRFAI